MSYHKRYLVYALDLAIVVTNLYCYFYIVIYIVIVIILLFDMQQVVLISCTDSFPLEFSRLSFDFDIEVQGHLIYT